jgi:hypothetical protein
MVWRMETMRALLITSAIVLSSACASPRGPSLSPEDSAAELPSSAAEPDLYAAYEFPAITDGWGPSEYAEVRDVLIEIEREQPERLVTLAGPKGAVLEHLASLDNITAAVASAPDIPAMLALMEAVGVIYKLYATRVAKQQPYGPEYLLLSAAALRLGAHVHAHLMTVIDEATLRAEPIRREGLMQMRNGLVVVYFGALETSLQLPSIVEPRATVAQLEPLAAEVAPFLLAHERQTLDQLLVALAGAGADIAQVSNTRGAIAASPIDPIFAAFADEAKAYSDKQRQLHADAAALQQPAVELGPEPGGIRYAFPDAGFSAVFHTRPNAMLMNTQTTDGVPATMRVLGIRDATGYSTIVTCVTRPQPPADADARGFALEIIEDAKATEIREVEISGRRGFEGELSSSISRAVVRAVELERGVCTLTTEYPPHLAASYEEQARAFLDSVQLGGFEG